MNLMQLIKLVLDDAYAGIKVKTGADKDKLILKELDALMSEYANLTCATRKAIEYSDPVKRFAYIYKYTVARI